MTPILSLHNVDVTKFLAVLDTCEGNVYLVTCVAEHIKSEKLALVVLVFANNTCFCNPAAFDKSCKTDKLAKLAAEIESVAFACNEIYIALAGIEHGEEFGYINIV